MANKFDLEKYLKENKVLSQSGRSLISEKKKMQEMDDDDTGASLEDLYQMDQEMLDKIKRDREEDDMMEAKDDEVEDIDVEDDEMEVEEPDDDEPIMGDEITDEQQELQKQLTQAYNSALKMGDEKLTTQLSNTITYYLKTLF
tara:strand:+ start:168 stop:596 length:429 start_codon:yes stop_codon:yes gene_type:complete